jgi:hypothetical protein
VIDQTQGDCKIPAKAAIPGIKVVSGEPTPGDIEYIVRDEVAWRVRGELERVTAERNAINEQLADVTGQRDHLSERLATLRRERDSVMAARDGDQRRRYN